MQRELLVLAGCAAALAPALPAAAQAVGAPLAPGAGSLIIDQQRQDRQTPAPPLAAAPPRPAPAAVDPGAPSAPTVRLKQIRLAGSDRLSGPVAAIAARFAGRPLDAQTIKQAADAVSAAYADTGLALYTVAVPRQDLSRGVLTLYVVEGYIAEVVIEGNAGPRETALIQAYARRLKAERPLRKAKLERYLSLIRDIPGATVDAQLFNTPAPGGIRLTVKIAQKRVDPEFTLNNRGTPRLGSVQAQGSIAINSLLTGGDQAKLVASVPTDIQRFQYVGLSYQAPIGSNGLTVIGSASYLRTRPDNPPIDGDATSAGVQLAYPILRGYTRNLTVSGGLDGLNSDNAIYGLSITSDHTRAVRGGLTYSETGPKRSASFSLTGSQGIEILGARADARLSDADFSKFNAQFGINQALSDTLVLRLRGLGQASAKRLPTAEQLPLGGEVFGRAFASASVTGDYGYAGSAELGWISPKPWPAPLKGSELYVFADGGRTWLRDRLPYLAAQRYSLASVGAGFRLLIRQKSAFGMELAKAVDAPFPGQNQPWRVIFSWKIAR